MANMSAPVEPPLDDEDGPGPTTDRPLRRTPEAGIEHPVQRLGVSGSGRLLIVVCVVVGGLATLVWQPWRPASTALEQQTSPIAALAAPTSAPSPSPQGLGSAPPDASGDLGAPPTQPYVSLIDNEWTVVALLSADGPVSTEEPSIQHGRGSWSPGDPLLVLQQGLDEATRPIEARKPAASVCTASLGSRDRPAVHLPGGRVAYLGVTFPGMDPLARVTASVVGRAGLALSRQASPIVRIRGLEAANQYQVPSSGSGGAVLFAVTPPVVLPAATYRFDIESPGISGHRYLYACVGT
jgi:hypothetical protein